MADINITLNAQEAIAEANALNLALDKIEMSVKSLSRYTKKLRLAGMLSVPRLAGDLADIQKRITARTRLKPLKIYAKIAIDKRYGIQTKTGRGKALLDQYAPGWYAEKSPSEQRSLFDKMVQDVPDYKTRLTKDELEDFKKLTSEVEKGTKLVGESWDRYSGYLDKVHGGQKKVFDQARSGTSDIAVGVEKDLKAYQEYEKLDKRARGIAGDKVGDVQRKVGNARAELERYYDEYRKGLITQDDYNKRLKASKGHLKDLEKEMGKVNKRGKSGQTVFAKLTRILVAIAAVLFIWQKVKQVINSVISVGEEYINTMANMYSQTGRTAAGSEELSQALLKSAEGTSFQLTGLYEAYYELRKAGFSSAEAIDKSTTAMKIARHEKMKLEDVSKLLRTGTEKEIDAMLRLNDAVSKTAQEASGRFTKTFKELIAEVYRREEPKLIEFFDDLTAWIKDHKDDLITGLQGIARGLETIASVAVKAGTGIVSVLGGAASLFKPGSVEMQQEELKLLEVKRENILNQMKDIPKRWSDVERKMIPKAPEDMNLLKYDLKEIDKKIASKKKEIKVTQDLESAEKEMSKIFIDDSEQILRSLDEVDDAYKKLTSSLGIMTLVQKNAADKQAGITRQQMLDVAAQKGDAKLRAEAEIWYLDQLFKNDQSYIKKRMDSHKEFFNITGEMATEYFDNEIKKRAHALGLMKLEESQRERLLRIFKSQLYLQTIASRLKGEQATFETTGYMSGWLKRRREIEALTAFRARRAAGMDETENARKLSADLLQIKKDEISKTLEVEENRFDVMGTATQAYIDSQKKMYKLLTDELVDQHKISREEANKMYDEWLAAFNIKLSEPYLSANDQLYTELYSVDEEYYNTKIALMTRAAKKLAEISKNEELAIKNLQRQLDALQIKKLRAGGEEGVQTYQGILAGMKELAMDNEPVSNRVADAWIQAASDIGQAWKSLFFDFMELNFDNLEDAAINVLKNIQRAAINILYQQTMYGPNGLISNLTKSLPSLFGNVSPLGGGAAAGATQLSTGAIVNTSGVVYGMQHGGIITEPISGVGLHTGRGYMLGEAGPEYVTPAGKSRQGQAPNMKVVVQNNTGVEATAEQGEIRWDGEAYVMNVVMNAYVNNRYGYRNMLRGK